MATPPVKKKTVGDLPGAFIIGFSVLCDLLKFVLIFLDAIPFVGIPVSFVGTWAVSLVEFLTVTLGLFMCGAYGGKNSGSSTLITLFVGMLDFTPVFDNLPETTVGTIILILKTRANDELEYKEAMKKYHASIKAEQEQELRQQRSLIAAQNAAATAANDNENVRFSAANDNVVSQRAAA